MKIEISRDSYQPEKRYSGVYQQQGRMLTDADWNELVEILKARLNDALKDVVGSKEGGNGGTPRHRALKIIKDSDAAFKIQPGHVYVDGVLAQIPGGTNIPYDKQPDFPLPPILPVNYILYADVWERSVTHLMDERLRDKGLHGADTCTRKQMMAQIKGCQDDVDPEQSVKNPPKGDAELTISLQQNNTQPDPCDPCAAVLGLESKLGNYLFRVEVHDVRGSANDPSEITLKWSRENGAEQFEAKATKKEMPAGFVNDAFVYEFFNEDSEKHLGVHLAGNTAFPDRRALDEVYPASLPNGFDFVRRWDGYAKFQWDILNSEWFLHHGISGGVDLTEDSSSTKADKVLKLDSVELKLQLLNRVVSGPVTSDGLAGTSPVDLVINEIEIGSANSSAKEKAAAINSANASVNAMANTVQEGIALSEKGNVDAGSLKVNDKDIGQILVAGNVEDQADAVVNAINAKFSSDPDFSASKTPEKAILLTATDGRTIKVEVIDIKTSRRCGFEKGKNERYGSITLISPSNSDITVTGEHPEYAGFIAGTTPAVQFVAGDYWLAEVREVEHKAGSVLIENKVPQGIEHHYLTLGKVVGGVLQPNPEADRKYAFPPLTEMTRMFMAGGTGQEVIPGQPLPQPLRVGVANGEWQVEGATVRFQIEAGGGSLSPVNDGKTNVDGVAECIWTPGSAIGAECRVKATLVDPDHANDSSKDMDPPVYFYANLITADQVAYTSDCPDSGENAVHSLLATDSAVSLDLGADGYYTVKEVLDALLCKLKAKHIPYDPNRNSDTASRWRDIKEQSSPKLLFEPNTVQEAIDDLIIWLESTDIRYEVPDCGTVSLPTVRYGLGLSAGTHKIDKIFDKLLCDFKATHLPLDKTDADLCDELKNDAQVKTVQDAINVLCERRSGGGCCSITIFPGDDLKDRLAAIGDEQDAHICITQGEYKVNSPVMFEDKGHITVQGCGSRTRVLAPTGESVFLFKNCKSAVVREIALQSGRVGEKGDYEHLNGTLGMHDVDAVTVDGVKLACPAAGERSASCLTIAYGSPDNKTASIRVLHSQLNPGHHQIGMLLVNVNRAHIEDNEIQVRKKSKHWVFKEKIKVMKFRRAIRRMLISNVSLVEDKFRNASVAFEGVTVCFSTDNNLLKSWERYFNNNLPEPGTQKLELIRHLKALADNILLRQGRVEGKGEDTYLFREWYQKMKLSLPAVAKQGIVCAGRSAADVRIMNNSIHGVAQGVHIGLSHNDSKGYVPYRAGRVQIMGNHMVMYLSAENYGGRHGIFVGNCESLDIECNHMKVERFPRDIERPIDGVRVFGLMGKMIQIRKNHMNDFNTGVFVRAIEPIPKNHLWQVNSNMLEGATRSTNVAPVREFLLGNNIS